MIQTINFVEHMIMAKDRLTKKNKTGAIFTDDGFAMGPDRAFALTPLGLAYILKLLDQYEQFDAVHWFQSCAQHYAAEKDKVGTRNLLLKMKARAVDSNAKSKEDDKLQEAVALSLKKISLYEKAWQHVETRF
jgi:WASH complex subunit 7